MSLDLSLVIRGNASSAGKALQETVADVKAVGAEAKQSNEQSAASARQAIDVLTGQTAAEKNLRAETANAVIGHERQIAVVRRMTSDVKAQTAVFALNRNGMMELRASGINAFQALAAGMSVTQVAMMEGGQVIGAFIQGTEGGLAGLKAMIAGAATSAVSFVGGPLPAMALALTAVGAAGAAAFIEIHDKTISSDDALALFKDRLDEIKKTAPDVAKAVSAIFNSPDSTSVLMANLKMSTNELEAGLQRSLQKLEVLMERQSGGGSYADYRQLLDLVDAAKTGAISVAELRDRLAQVYLDPSTAANTKELAGKLLEGSKDARVFANELAGLNGAIGQIGSIASAQIADVDALNTALSTLAGIELPALSASEKAQNAFVTGMKNAPDAIVRAAVQNAYNAAQQRIEDAKGPYGDGNIPIPVTRPNIEMEGMPWVRKSSGINAYDRITKSARDRIVQLRTEQQMLGKTGVAAAQLAYYQELLSRATNHGRTVTESQRKELEALAETYGKLKEQTAALTFIDERKFDMAQLGRTQDEQRIYGDLRSRGIDINTPEGQAAASADRSIIALTELKSTANDAFSALVGGLERGENAWQAMGDAATSVLDAIEKKLQDRLISYLFDGAGSGGTGFFSWLSGGAWGASAFPAAPAGPIASGMSLADWGFAGGGFTGAGGKFDPKGIVHAGEFVFDAAATRAIGVDNLYRLQDAAQRGFAEGGYAMPWTRSSKDGATAGNVYLTVNNNGEPVDADAHQTVDSNGDRHIEVFLDKKIDDRVLRPSSPTNKRLREMGLKPPVVMR